MGNHQSNNPRYQTYSSDQTATSEENKTQNIILLYNTTKCKSKLKYTHNLDDKHTTVRPYMSSEFNYTSTH